MYEKNSKEVNIMNGIERWGQKLQVLSAIDALKDKGDSDETIVNYVTKRYPVTPDYVLTLIKEWHDSIQIQEQSKAPNTSVPAGA